MSHTPGPWTAHKNNEPNYIDIDGGSSERICSLYVDEESLPMAEEAVANGHLIAAAPDLLAALHRLIQSLPEDCNEYPDSASARQVFDSIRFAREVISKATGGAA